MLRTVATAALALTPALASAQGARGGGGEGGGGAAAGDRAGGAGDRMEGGGGGRSAGAAAERGAERGAREGARDVERGAERGGRAAERGAREGVRDVERGGRAVERDRVVRDRNGRDRDVNVNVRTGVREGGGRGVRHATLSTEQRTQFRTRVRGLGGDRIRGGDFAVRAGTVVPERYKFRTLPAEVVETVPEYRGYDYGLVDDEVVIVEPGSREIVDVLE